MERAAMTFVFDVDEATRKAGKETPTTANPAKAANPVRNVERISNISNISKPSDPEGWDYELADLKEMDRLLCELAELEGWTDEELADLLNERRRMAPANVRSMLEAVRKAHAMALAPWPESPKERSSIVLCPLTTKRRLAVVQGGKSSPVEQAGSQSGGRGLA
jgi:hypothetical protein